MNLRPIVVLSVVGLAVVAAASVGSSAQGSPAQQDLLPSFTIGEWSGDFPNFVANPAGVAIYEHEIYVLDVGNKRVAVFNLGGEFVRAFGRAGEGPGEFGLGSARSINGPDIAVSDDQVFVNDARQRKIHVFETDGKIVGSYVVNRGRTSAQSLTVFEGTVYLGMSGSSASADVLVFEPWVTEPVVFSERMISPSSSEASRFNQSQIAVGKDGKLMQAYWWWPMLRLHRPRSITDARFVDDSWWDYMGENEFLPHVRTWFEEARTSGAPSGFSRLPFFFDVEYIAGTDSWVTLSNGDRIEFFGDDRELGRQFQLLPPAGEEKLVVFDIGVDDQGRLLCAADPQELSEVLCYDIPALE